MQKLGNRLGASTSALVALTGIASTLGIAAMIFLKIPFLSVVTFLLFQLVCVALPGITVVKLFRLKLTPLENLTASYGVGLLINILVYFIFSPSYLGGLIPFVIWSIALLSAITLFIIRSRRMSAIEDRGELRVGLIFAYCMAILTFVLLSATTLTPDIAGTRGYYHDLTNGIGLITSAYNGFPMEFMQMSGTTHYYHPFFYAYSAVIKHCLGFSSFDIGTKFSLISIAPFFACAFVCVARKVFHKTRNIVIAAVSTMLFFYVMVYYTTIDMLGFPLSIAFALLAVVFLMKGEEVEGKIFNRYHVVSMLFLIGCLGAKGANGVTTLFAVCFVLLLSLFRKGRFLRIITTGLLYAAPFFGAYFLLYQQGPESMLLRGMNLFGPRWDILETLPESWPDWLRVFLANAGFTIDYHTLMVVCFVIFLVYLIFFRKRPEIIVDYSFGGLLCGFVLSNVFMQHGSSEIYFIYTVIPMAVIAAIFCLIRFLLAFKGRWRYVAGAVMAALLLPLLIPATIENVTKVAGDVKTAITYSAYSKNKILTDEQIASLGSSERANALTPQEYEGLVWLRDNTDQNAIVAEGRHLIHNKYFYGTAFGERRFYLEGWGYVTMEDSNTNTPEKVRREGIIELFYGVEDETFIPLLRKEGIQYVIIYEYSNPGWRLKNEFDSVTVFENEHIVIYDIRGGTA